MQGRRPKQEDRHVKIPDLTKAAKALKMPIDHLDQPCAFFAVYDGHQGHLCAEFIAKGFHGKLLKKLSANTDGTFWTDEKIKGVLSEILEELDAEFLAKFRTAPDGCTVVVSLVTGERLFVAWVGDSQCLLCRKALEDGMDVVALTEDHRPSATAEADRVKQAGGVIVNLGFGTGVPHVAHPGYEERVREMRREQALGLGTKGKEPVAMPVSRALGDREFKAVTGRALLVPTPGVTSLALTRSDSCIALMCDGITNVMTKDDVFDELLAEVDVRAACGALVQEAYKRESQDNLTVILVRLAWEGSTQPRYGQRPDRSSAMEPVVESKAAVSKRRRLDAASAVNKQKVAAYERAVAAEEKVAQGKAAEEAEAAAARAAVAAEVQAKAAAVAESKALGEKRKAAEIASKAVAEDKAESEPPVAVPPVEAGSVTSASVEPKASEAVPADEGEEDDEEFFI
jgi:serine/threonine protein phosphatase PrpC